MSKQYFSYRTRQGVIKNDKGFPFQSTTGAKIACPANKLTALQTEHALPRGKRMSTEGDSIEINHALYASLRAQITSLSFTRLPRDFAILYAIHRGLIHM